MASLTQSGFYYLLMKVTHFLTRPESDEVVRDVDPESEESTVY